MSIKYKTNLEIKLIDDSFHSSHHSNVFNSKSKGKMNNRYISTTYNKPSNSKGKSSYLNSSSFSNNQKIKNIKNDAISIPYIKVNHEQNLCNLSPTTKKQSKKLIPNPQLLKNNIYTLNEILKCNFCQQKLKLESITNDSEYRKYNSTSPSYYFLSCGHFICSSCLIYISSNQVKCPIDNKTICRKNIKKFDIYKNQKLIDNNLKNNSSYYGTINKLNDIDEDNDTSEYCPIHLDKQLTHYDTKNYELLCICCAINRIKMEPECIMNDINSGINFLSNELLNITMIIKNKMNIIKQIIGISKNNFDNELAKINSFYSHLFDEINKNKNEMIKKLNDLFVNNENNLIFSLNNLDNQIKEVNNMFKNYDIWKEKPSVFIQDLLKFKIVNNDIRSMEKSISYEEFNFIYKNFSKSENVIFFYLGKISRIEKKALLEDSKKEYNININNLKNGKRLQKNFSGNTLENKNVNGVFVNGGHQRGKSFNNEYEIYVSGGGYNNYNFYKCDKNQRPYSSKLFHSCSFSKHKKINIFNNACNSNYNQINISHDFNRNNYFKLAKLKEIL